MKLFVMAPIPLLLLLGCPDHAPKDSTSSDDLDADGWTEAEGDCDDYDAAVNPDENEIWYDGEDQDCDGNDDDQDLDGHGVATDCDDVDDAVNPDAEEVCDGLDNDCDGGVDIDAPEAGTLYADADADGYGDPATETVACPTAGWVDVGGDCDDTDGAVNPTAQEVCNDVDDNCDGQVNEGQPEEVTYYLDADQDGYGDPEQSVTSCQTPTGYTSDATDCDDLAPDVHPGAEETCDEIDRDCDGDPIGDAGDAVVQYADADGDAHGDPATALTSCEELPGYVAAGDDCDDTSADAFPGNAETCDGIDNDCDATVDDGVTTTFYADVDADGYGDAAAAAELCALESGYTTDATDCDDGDPETWPGAVEVCDLEDNDCDGTVDDDATDPRTYYLDADSDGYGDASVTSESCGAPTGYVDLSTDCDDDDASVNPGAAEVCDTLDQDCDGTADDDATDADTWYADDDGDTYGDAGDVTLSCDQPSGHVADATDCDDARAANHPGADEVCADAQDNDCDGSDDEADAVDATTWYLDADADSHGVASTTQVACERPSGYAASDDDCDDATAAVNPGVGESCNDVDDDCDGAVDESGATGESTWYLDADADTYGVSTSTALACDVPAGYAAVDGDCDDDDATASPAAAETDDGADDDCDGWVDEDFVATGDIIVSEVTRQPRFGAAATNSNGYWFEVHNASSRAVDLSNWYVQRTSSVGTDGFYVDPDDALVVDPGAYVVLCKTDDYTAAAQASYSTLVCDYVWGDESQSASYTGTYHDNTFNLQRDEDTLQLYVGGDASTGTLVDDVHWVWSSTGTQWPRTAQYSMALDPTALDGTANDDVANWCVAATTDRWWYVSSSNVEYGTPGAENGACF